MNKLVTPTAAKVRCDIFPCKELAKYSIGPEGRRQLAYNVCDKHGKEIMADFNELILIETVGTNIIHIDASNEPVEAGEPGGEAYTCKYCGAPFSKTKDGKSEYMRHCKVCPSKPTE